MSFAACLITSLHELTDVHMCTYIIFVINMLPMIVFIINYHVPVFRSIIQKVTNICIRPYKLYNIILNS